MKLFKKGKLALLAGAMAMAVSGAFGNFASAADVTINMAVSTATSNPIASKA